MLVAATLVPVAAALYAGIRTDQTANRRRIVIRAALLVLAAASVMTVAASTLSFLLA